MTQWVTIATLRCVKTLLILALSALFCKRPSKIFSYRRILISRIRFRATLNFRKFKVAWNVLETTSGLEILSRSFTANQGKHAGDFYQSIRSKKKTLRLHFVFFRGHVICVGSDWPAITRRWGLTTVIIGNVLYCITDQ